MATRKKSEAAEGEVAGRALVDIPLVGAKSGDFISLPAEVAKALTESGEFDPKAVKPE